MGSTKIRRRRNTKRRKPKLSPQELDKRRKDRRFKRQVRAIFTNAGFTYIPSRDLELNIGGMRGEFDAVYAYDNILIIVEDTQLGDPSDHLRKKVDFYEYIKNGREAEALVEMDAKLPGFAAYRSKRSEFGASEYRLVFLYCSSTRVSEQLRTRHASTCFFLDTPTIRYFLSLTKTIHKTARFEIFKFLGLEASQIGHASSSSLTVGHDALLLPEVPSGFPAGHKLVSFLASPAVLLEQSYVLRADSWRDTTALYQRLLIKSKIANMRTYLVTDHRVFVNNIIVSLPHDTSIESRKSNEGLRNLMAPVTINIPKRFNAIGIIDGQHRVFAYHEGNDKNELGIKALREKQHLLVTGIIYPPGMEPRIARQFEAKLFLEINDKQKRVRPDLKQAIELVVSPFSTVAVAKAVVDRLAAHGPLEGRLSVHFFDSAKLKTASIVAYGLPQIVKLEESPQSLFRTWPGANKKEVQSGKDAEGLEQYIAYSASEINKFVAGFKLANLALWTEDKKVSRVFTTTAINSLLYCLRRVIEANSLAHTDRYKTGFEKAKFDFSAKNFRFGSSSWKQLGDKLFEQCFETHRRP